MIGVIEIFALIAATLALVKILVILTKPGAWGKLTAAVWKSPGVTSVICLVLGAIVFYYLIQEISIIQIFAVILLIALISALSISAYSKEFVGIAGKMLKDRNFLRKGWLAILIWMALILWALKEILL